MALKKSVAKSPKAAAPRKDAAGEIQAVAPVKVTRRRASAAATHVRASAETPVAARPKPAARRAKATVAVDSVAQPAATQARPVTDEDIRVRAYFLALESQGRGPSLDYWLRAERELRGGAAAAD